MQSTLNTRGFYIGSAVTTVAALALLMLVALYGQRASFLMLNGDGGRIADYFLRFLTHFGDALLWIPMIGYVIWKKRKVYLALVTGSLVVGTILVQGFKMFILPGQPRPTKYITDAFIHTVDGVTVHTYGSFPSGHTATAFGLFLIICLMRKSKWWLVVGWLVAFLVGYSRIYLAQHFPLDVAVGMLIGVISVWVSIPFQQWIDRRNIRITEKTSA